MREAAETAGFFPTDVIVEVPSEALDWDRSFSIEYKRKRQSESDHFILQVAMFSEPVALRVPRQTLRKTASGRRARSAWLLVGGPPQRRKAKTSECSRAPRTRRLRKVSTLANPTGFEPFGSCNIGLLPDRFVVSARF